MIERSLHPRIEHLLARNPAVGILGPRQSGKTTLALEIGRGRPSIYLDLERPSDLARLAEPELYLASHVDKLVILDEIQRLPGIFQTLRGLIDEGRRKGRKSARFLVLGSASIELIRQSTESLAGRIAYAELAPFSALEIGDSAAERDRLWLRGGFPESYLAPDDASSIEWRQSFIQTYLERDIPQLGPRVPAETLRRFWTMLAHTQGALLNASRFSASLGVSGSTVARYLDLLADLLLVRRLAPWSSNAGKRLVHSPKVYVRDSGLVHALLGIRTNEDLLGHPVAGLSWEGQIIETLAAAAPAGSELSFYRTAAGAEIDLLISMGSRRRWAIEVKRSLAPKPSHGFHRACEDLKPSAAFVVYPGGERFALQSGVDAIGIRELAAELAEASS